MPNVTEVDLTVHFRGSQVQAGSYETTVSKTEEGEVTALKVLDTPSFAKVTQHISLNESFVKGALSEPPKGMKMKLINWLGIPEEERLKIHIHRYADDLFPNRKFYTYKLL